MLQHVARYVPVADLKAVVAFTRQKFAGDLSTQYNLYNTLGQGLAQRGGKADPNLLDWGAALAAEFIKARNEWTYQVASQTLLGGNPLRVHRHKDGAATYVLLGFEQYGTRGQMRSPVFEAPASLAFAAWLHDDDPKGGSGPSEHAVRLRLADDTGKVVAGTQFTKGPARERLVTTQWDLSAVQGKKVYLDVHNGAKGYVRVGHFEPAAVRVPAVSPAETANRQKFALGVIGSNALVSFAGPVKTLLADPVTDPFVRVAATRTLLQLDAPAHAALVGKLLADTGQTLPYRKEIAQVMGEFALPGVTGSLVKALNGAPYDFQLALVKALAASPEGKTALLSQVRGGKLPARILLDPKVEERVLLNASAPQRRDYQELTANLDPVNQEREKLIQQRLARFSSSNIQRETGRVVFIQNCSPCHQIKKEGGLIGPQLDGVGNWGAQLLATKILDPNRNISEAFRTYTIRLKDGNVLTGLYRREEGQVLVFANMAGEEFSVPKKDLAEKQASKYTLMPDHFGEVLEQENFNALLTYLLAQQ
jgi:putative heme-binding domain-containing protein